jgi:hypothetical protein
VAFLLITLKQNEEVVIDRYTVKPIIVGTEVSGLIISGPRIRKVYIPLRGGIRIEKLPKKVKRYIKKTYGIEV